jgi:hypothetical protein
MSDGSSTKDSLLRQQIKAMDPEGFEQLVFELAHRLDPAVRRLSHPDGGADTLRPQHESTRARVWQAKRYTGQMNWQECARSLQTAIDRWKPERVTFAFARDFSESTERNFQERLVRPARSKEVEVQAWTLSEIVRQLGTQTDLRVRFFGQEQMAEVDLLVRTMRAGGKLTSPLDLFDRARSLAEFSEEADPKFTYSTSSGGPSTPAPRWDKLPYMTMSYGDEIARVEVATWPREGVEVEPPTFWFLDTEIGQKARLDAVRALAAGATATVREGAKLRLAAPKLFEEKLAAKGGGEATLFPGDPLPLKMELESDSENLDIDLEVRPVPPPPGAAAAFAGFGGGVLVEINLFLKEEPDLAVRILLHGEFTESASSSLDTARTLWAFQNQKRIALGSGTLFPSGEISGNFGSNDMDDGQVAELRARFELYRDVVYLEERLERSFTLPDRFTHEEVLAVQAAAEILRTGEGRTSLQQVSGEVENPMEIPFLPQQFAEADPVRKEITASIFGQEVSLGMGEFDLPQMKIVEVVPHGKTADAPARVVLEAKDDPLVVYRLVDKPEETSLTLPGA